MNNKIAIVIQARMGSKRLPGKTLMKISGKPLIHYQISRLQKSKLADKIIVITTKKKEDDILCDYLKDKKIDFFRGSTNNLLERHYQVSKKHNLDYIVRIPGDNPLPEVKEIDKIIKYHIKSNNAFSTNLSEILNSGYPDGIGAEIISFWALEKMYLNIKVASKKEHPHLCFFDYKKDKAVDAINFPVGTIRAAKNINFPMIRLDINTKKDFLYISKIIESLEKQKKTVNIKNIINLLS